MTFAKDSFNGATAFQRWKRVMTLTNRITATYLQWGHRLSAMETRIGAGCGNNPLPPSMGPPPFSDGNWLGVMAGGRRLSPFNGATAFQRWEPLSGKLTSRPLSPFKLSPFNGATAFQRWKRGGWPMPTTACGSFNGATAFQRWKPATPATSPRSMRSFNGATAFQRWKRPGTGSSAHGSWPAFNGATAFQRWKLVQRPVVPLLLPPFNGATAFQRWKPG